MRLRAMLVLIALLAGLSSAWAAGPTLCGGTKTTSFPTKSCPPPASPS